MKKLRYLLVLIPAIFILTPGCSQADFSAKLGETSNLAVGQSVEIAGEDLLITFDGVSEDSRCPQGAACIWEGRARILVSIVHEETSHSVTLEEQGFTEDARETFLDYTLNFHLQPYPVAGEVRSTDDYRLSLTVSK